MKRVFFDILLFLSIFILPWWVSAFVVFVGIFVFEQFYEFIAGGILMYVLYATEGTRLISSHIWFPAILSIIYLGIQTMRRYIIIFRNV